MSVIGVYDSGIGGLTTAKILLNRFIGNDIYYLADNLNHPFGNTDEATLKEIVHKGIKHVRAHSDIVVLACNTASSVTDDKDVIKLLPPVGDFLDDAENTVLMATARTLSKLENTANFKIADTHELATLIEVQASLNSLKGNLDMKELLPYLAKRLYTFKGAKRVILGCSHYLYCIPQIQKVLGDIEIVDGNEKLCQDLSKHIFVHKDRPSKITFDYSAQNDSKKYNKILQLLLNKVI